MNYFLIKYTKRLPNEFGGTTQGPFIRLLVKYKNDIGLIEHEKTHVRQWYTVLVVGLLLCTALMLLVTISIWPLIGLAPVLHQFLYKFFRPYRRWCEVRAYRKQIKSGGYVNNDFAVIALVDKYDLRISTDEARELLID